MKRAELKKILKPLIKECIKEVIFEEGTLSTIISEVMKGTGTRQVIKEEARPSQRLETNDEAKHRRQQHEKKLQHNRKKMLDSIGRDAYNGVDLFEGTKPMAAERNSAAGGSKALEGVSPNDPGVDLAGFGLPQGTWKKLAGS